MKKNVLLSITISAIFAACNFSKGVNTDLTTGLTTTNNGLSINKVFLTDKDNNELSSNIVALGSVIQVVVTEVENFTEQNGKVYPCCTILLKNKNIVSVSYTNEKFSDLIGLKWIFFLLLTLLSIEWFVRKRSGGY